MKGCKEGLSAPESSRLGQHRKYVGYTRCLVFSRMVLVVVHVGSWRAIEIRLEDSDATTRIDVASDPRVQEHAIDYAHTTQLRADTMYVNIQRISLSHPPAWLKLGLRLHTVHVGNKTNLRGERIAFAHRRTCSRTEAGIRISSITC